jgi:hypothetical protein
MSYDINKLIKGVILLILGLFITYKSVILYLKNIFTFIGLIIIVLGIYEIFIDLFKIYTEKKLKSPNTSRNQPTINDIKKNQNQQNKTLNKPPINDEKLHKTNLKPEKKHSQTNNETLIFTKSEKSNNSNPMKSKIKNDQNNILKSENSDLNSSKSKSNKKKSSKYIFTPNYQKPSKVIRKPVKKNLENPLKSNKIKPNLSINQLSKILGLETKEEEELQRLKEFLAEENNSQTDNINDLNNDLTNINPNLNDLDNNKFDLDNNISDLDVNNLDTENNIAQTNLFDDFDYNPSKENSNLKNENNAKSYFTSLDEIQVLYENRILNITKALEKLINKGEKEIFIAVPSLNFLSNKLINELNNLNSKIIIEKKNTHDIAHSLIISSISKDYASIRTTQSVENIIAIIDKNHALLVTKPINSAIGIGAVFTKKEEINSIKNTFDTLWDVSMKL